MKKMRFMMKMIPPTVTAQMHKVGVRNGKPFFYDPPEVKEARAKLMAYLAEHKPEVPLEGPLFLSVTWYWPTQDRHKDREWKITKPDTDNLQKLLKDCMTQLGFWKDDAQVAVDMCSKFWVMMNPGIEIVLMTKDEYFAAEDVFYG